MDENNTLKEGVQINARISCRVKKGLSYSHFRTACMLATNSKNIEEEMHLSWPQRRSQENTGYASAWVLCARLMSLKNIRSWQPYEIIIR